MIANSGSFASYNWGSTWFNWQRGGDLLCKHETNETWRNLPNDLITNEHEVLANFVIWQKEFQKARGKWLKPISYQLIWITGYKVVFFSPSKRQSSTKRDK